ncbi:MAG: YihY/virulence factor BrkB family protein [Actinomycetota bacterium]|nr:YihY/virulence factor BrkB family protein [Actinomycetota bacterium]
MASLQRRVRQVVRAYADNDLLTSASAIAFQVVTAIIPFVLFLCALLGFLDLERVWRDDVASGIRDKVSPALFDVINSAVTNAITHRQAFWLTAGGLLAVWEISGAVRATMGALNRVYDVEESRPLRTRLAVSTGLAVAVGVCFAGAIAVVRLGPLLLGGHQSVLVGAASFAVRWALALGLLGLATGLLVRLAPAARQPLGWVSAGSALTLGCWLAMSLLFGWYITSLAAYGSIFGSLAAVFVAFTYIYLSAMAFLFGVQLDAIVRREMSGSPTGGKLRTSTSRLSPARAPDSSRSRPVRS